MVNAEHFRSVQEEILLLQGDIERRDIVLEQLSKALFLLVQEVGKLPENGNASKQGPDLNKAYTDAYDLLVLIGKSMEPLDAWCCENGKNLGVQVCPGCDAMSRDYSAAMGPDVSPPNAKLTGGPSGPSG